MRSALGERHSQRLPCPGDVARQRQRLRPDGAAPDGPPWEPELGHQLLGLLAGSGYQGRLHSGVEQREEQQRAESQHEHLLALARFLHGGASRGAPAVEVAAESGDPATAGVAEQRNLILTTAEERLGLRSASAARSGQVAFEPLQDAGVELRSPEGHRVGEIGGDGEGLVEVGAGGGPLTPGDAEQGASPQDMGEAPSAPGGRLRSGQGWPPR